MERKATRSLSAGGESKRLAARDWEIAALEMIGETGVAGLAVEPLARRLGVTKGSFYWHFRNADELLTASLARWERVYTDGKYGALSETTDPGDRLRALFADVTSGDRALGIFHALSLEQENPAVRTVFRRVTAKRLRFLETALGDLGLSRTAAADRAVVLYSAYIGFLQLCASLPSASMTARRRGRLVREAFRLLIPEVAC